MGYQDLKETKELEKILLGGTFQKIDGSKLKLADVKPNAQFTSSDTLTLLDAAGGTKGKYVFIDESLVDEVKSFDDKYLSFTAGWYGNDDWDDFVNNIGDLPDAPVCQNDLVEFESGECFMLMPSADGVGVNFDGQVAQDDIEVFGKELEKTFRCNCTPVPITLGDIKPNALFTSSDTLTILNTTGGTKGKYVFIDESLVEEVKSFDDKYLTFTAGWYGNDDWDDFVNNIGDLPDAPVCQNDLVEFGPGLGFFLTPSSDGAGVIIPSAL